MGELGVVCIVFFVSFAFRAGSVLLFVILLLARNWW